MKSLESYIYKRHMYFLILFILIGFSKSLLSFNFPYGLTLSNGNIFIIHQKGVTICDNHLSTIILNVITFSEDEEIKTEDSLSKITTAFEYGYIISIINDKIYIFDENGTSIYNGTDKIISSGETAKYYTLIPYKKQENDYHYVVGYINGKKLNLLYYKYIFPSNSNNLFISSKDLMHDYRDNNGHIRYYYFENNALSCQYMKDSRNKTAIVCFFITKDVGSYSDSYYLTVDYYLPSDNSIILHADFLPDDFGTYNIKCIKTALSPDLSKVLIGMYSSTGILYYCLFDIFEFKLKYNQKQSYCRNQYHALKFNYYIEKHEFICSCINDNGKISVEFFNSNYLNYNSTFKYIECETIFGYSILFINNDQKY